VSGPLRFVDRGPYGVCVGIAVPGGGADPATVLRKLHPAERALALELPPGRRGAFAAGRLALAHAFGVLGLPRRPVLRTRRGAPRPPPGAAVSVSHAGGLAVALVALDGERWSVGVDVEPERELARALEREILSARERRRLAARPGEARGRALLAAFALKEAAYKALDPLYPDRVGPADLEVESLPPGLARCTCRLPDGAGSLKLEVGLGSEGGYLIATARAPHPTP